MTDPDSTHTTDRASEPHVVRLLELTGLPTATGREGRVVEWVEHWVAERPSISLQRDKSGNILLLPNAAGGDGAAPNGLLLFTAHLDHPAFVVEQVLGDADAGGALALTFRGGVLDPYFRDAAILVHCVGGAPVRARLVEVNPAKPLRACVAEAVEGHSFAHVMVGDVATWDLPDPEIIDGELHAPACDDLAAVAAALGAFETLLRDESRAQGVGVLLTLAEEVGFIGAIAACKDGFIPKGSRLLALENSRAFAESPIGGGPIVRVGDRMSTFTPWLTHAAGAACERIAARRKDEGRAFRWQRRLMPGGACEATCFCAYGFDATCLCLPLGNYHNMGNLDDVQAGDASRATIAPERISVDDYLGLIDVLIECGRGLGEPTTHKDAMEKLFAERAFVLKG